MYENKLDSLGLEFYIMEQIPIMSYDISEHTIYENKTDYVYYKLMVYFVTKYLVKSNRDARFCFPKIIKCNFLEFSLNGPYLMSWVRLDKNGHIFDVVPVNLELTREHHEEISWLTSQKYFVIVIIYIFTQLWASVHFL